jgi:uncharacterized protein (TIGR02001 family)
MKEINKKLLAGVLATLTLAASALTSVANAEVAGSVGAANMYYWRGYNLGTDGGVTDSDGDDSDGYRGNPAIWGDLNVSGGPGLYAGVWMSSGDSTAGTEYDIYFGWGKEFGDFGVDISYWSYNYPELQNADGDSIFIGDFAEIVLALSYGPVAFTYYDNIAPGDDFNGPGSDFASDEYSYFTLGVDVGPVNIKYGEHADADGSAFDGYSHLDLTYAFNDNLSFTMGNVIDDVDGANNDETKFIVNVTIPIE